VAICADQLAFRDLSKHTLSTTALCKIAQCRLLVLAWQVVPVHCNGVKGESTVGAWLSSLEAGVPGQELGLPPGVLRLPTCVVLLLMSRRVVPSARLAPRLVPVAAVPMKLGERLIQSASSAVSGLGRGRHGCVPDEHMFAPQPDTYPEMGSTQNWTSVLITFTQRKSGYDERKLSVLLRGTRGKSEGDRRAEPREAPRVGPPSRLPRAGRSTEPACP
jgi:hypothetical protein